VCVKYRKRLQQGRNRGIQGSRSRTCHNQGDRNRKGMRLEKSLSVVLSPPCQDKIHAVSLLMTCHRSDFCRSKNPEGKPSSWLNAFEKWQGGYHGYQLLVVMTGKAASLTTSTWNNIKTRWRSSQYRPANPTPGAQSPARIRRSRTFGGAPGGGRLLPVLDHIQ
jgi:hypothetical protein